MSAAGRKRGGDERRRAAPRREGPLGGQRSTRSDKRGGSMTLWFYSLLTWLLQPLLRWKLRRRGRREAGYLEAIEERFGRYGESVEALAPNPNGWVWVHAVSMGETRAAAILVDALRQQWPGMRLLLTHGTATGRAEGTKLLLAGDAQVWLPWDSATAVNRFLQRFAPRIGILLETELWPKLLAACRDRGIPVALVNARLNPRSLRRAQRLSWLARPAYAGLAMVLAQTEADAGRLLQVGATVHGVHGNLKFDATPDPAQLRRGRAWRLRSERPLLMFASSREGEEEAWLLVWLARSARSAAREAASQIVQQPRWLVVPRHPQRFDEVAQLIEASGISLSRCSQWIDGPDEQALACDVWLGDSLGDMTLYYAMSDAALLGGSFAPLGGHNLIEAAACNCPLVMGPHTFNFAEAARQSVAAGAALQVDSMGLAMPVLNHWLEQPEARRAAMQACASFAEQHRGCLAKTVLALTSLLRERRGNPKV